MSAGRFEHHIPVLLDQVLDCASPLSGGVWVDCTLGFGGHTEALLLRGAQVVGVDQDPDTLSYTKERLSDYSHALTCVLGNFRDLPKHLDELGIQAVDGVLADLGVSSKQFDDGKRGFSFSKSGPIDMRMSSKGETAEALIARLDTRELAQVIRRYGEEKFAMPIAKAIHKWFDQTDERTTSDLAAVIESALPQRVRMSRNHHPATKTFQALRIKVNDELGALENLLDTAPTLFRDGGRLLIISFHSLEDRLVKKAYQGWSGEGPPIRGSAIPLPSLVKSLGRRLTNKPLVAHDAELEANPRSRSAKLRAFEFHGRAA